MIKMNRVLKCDQYLITQYFGGNNNHKGIDIVGRKDGQSIMCPIIAHTEGEVVWVQTGQKNNLNAKGNLTYGNAVKIKHSDGYYTLYAHLSKVYVSKGQHVKTGQEIGYMGNTGYSKGFHLHWELRKPNEVRIDPRPYLNADLPDMANYYWSYDNKYNRWLPKVKINDTKQYAGNIGNGISGLRVEDVTEYKVHDKVKGYWLPAVKGTKDYAGNLSNDIDGVAIKTGKYKYQVHLLTSNRWLPYVTGYDTKDKYNGYAGNIGETIDAIRIVNK